MPMLKLCKMNITVI